VRAVALFAAGGTAPTAVPVALAQGVLRAMTTAKLKVLVPCLLVVALAAGAAGRLAYQAHAAGEAEKPPVPAAAAPAAQGTRPSKLDLTPETFAAFRDLVRPADNEWRHLKVRWLTDIVAARKKAAKEDKPILVFRTGGAGYNDPMGVC
jgi:hypothetical protein